MKKVRRITVSCFGEGLFLSLANLMGEGFQISVYFSVALVIVELLAIM